MELLPTWMRRALLATAAMNLGAGLLFLPPAASLRALAGFPPGDAVYLLTIALFVLLFAAGYLYCGVTGRPERLFLWLSAVGKLSFVTILVSCWALGVLPVTAPLSGAGDAVFGVLFLTWLLGDSARA